MKTLYKVPGYSVVYAENAEAAIRSLSGLDSFDAWQVIKDNIKEIKEVADLPAGWSELQSALDSVPDTAALRAAWLEDPWTRSCISTIMSKKKQLKELSPEHAKEISLLLERIEALEHILARK